MNDIKGSHYSVRHPHWWQYLTRVRSMSDYVLFPLRKGGSLQQDVFLKCVVCGLDGRFQPLFCVVRHLFCPVWDRFPDAAVI